MVSNKKKRNSSSSKQTKRLSSSNNNTDIKKNDAATTTTRKSKLPASSSTTAVITNAMIDKTMTCYHGFDPSICEIDNKRFTKFVSIIDKFVALQKNPPSKGKNPFSQDQQDTLTDPEFHKFVFSYAVEKYLRGNFQLVNSNGYTDTDIKGVMSLGLSSKYYLLPETADDDMGEELAGDHYKRSMKYCREVNTERGLINCLARETLPYGCDCMIRFKLKAQSMEPKRCCSGCQKQFPKSKLQLCQRCETAEFCSKECLKRNWRTHKQYCAPFKELRSIWCEPETTCEPTTT